MTLIEKAASLPAETLFQLCKLAKHVKTDLSILFEQIYHEKTNRCEKCPDAFEKVRGIAIRKPVDKPKPAEPFREKPDELLQDLMEKNGQGMSMSRFVFELLNNGELALIESEPGFEMKLSYMLSAALFSIQNNQTVVVAASTIQGQQYMLEKIVPAIHNRFGLKVNVQLLKGKNQYLNIRKFERVLKQENEHYDEVITKMQILVWLTETVTGDVDELNLSTGGMHFGIALPWIRFKTEKDPWEKWDFYNRAVDLAKSANIILTNHHFCLLI